MITPSQLDSITTIADNDIIMLTHSNGTTEKITGENFKKQVLAYISNFTAVTSIADTDIIYIKQSDNSLKKITGAYLKTALAVDTVAASNMNPVTSNAVDAKIKTLDVSSVGGSGKYISAISETDGKISATATNIANTYSSTGTTPISGTGVKAALQTLDVSSVGGSGKYISAISETDGKISATATNLATSVTSGSNVPVTGGAVYNAITAAMSYSETEVNTGTTWIDGKTIYKLTFQSTTPSLNNNWQSLKDLSSYNIAHILQYYGYATNGNHQIQMPCNFTQTHLNYPSNGHFGMNITNDTWLSKPCVITIFYTKSS